MNQKYTVAALRRTWDALASRAFEETGEDRMTAEEVRRYVSNYIEGEDKKETAKRKLWDPLPDEEKQRLLEEAFPEDSYARADRGNVLVSAPASVDISELRRMLESRGFTPVTLEETVEHGRTATEVLDDCIDRAEWVLFVLPHHGAKSNVFIELGYALAKRKRVLAIVPPDERPPLEDIPYLRTALDNREAIGFRLDQMLSAPKVKGKPRKDSVKKTKPLGHVADDLLERVRADRAHITEREAVAILHTAIQESGVSALSSELTHADKGADLAVWSDDLEPLIENPVVIEVKRQLHGGQYEQAVKQLSGYLDTSRAQVGLLIYVFGNIPIDVGHDPRIYVFSLEDFLSELKTAGFADLLFRMRNRRVHGVR